MRNALPVCFALAALLSGACSSSGGGGGTPGPGGDGGGLADLGGGGDTPAGPDGGPGGDGVVAETDDGGEPPAPLCTSDEACIEDGAICTCKGECVVRTGSPCVKDINCPPGNWCNPCDRTCKARAGLCETCDKSEACADQGACLPFVDGGNHCGKVCLSDVGCPPGFTCLEVEGVASKQCVPNSATCTDLGLCADDAECPDAEICSDTLKICAPGCDDDESCGVDLVCVKARCVPPCATADECAPGEECTAEGHCKLPGSCESGAECPDPETHCDKKTGMCEDGCLSDADCKDAAYVCEQKACVPKGCEHNFQCGFEQECQKADGQCVPMADPHCAECDAEADNQCGGEPNLCVTFQAENPDTGEVEDKGDFCLLPCKDDPVDKCPQAYGCEQVETEEGVAFYCVRMCYFQPVDPSAP